MLYVMEYSTNGEVQIELGRQTDLLVPTVCGLFNVITYAYIYSNNDYEAIDKWIEQKNQFTVTTVTSVLALAALFSSQYSFDAYRFLASS